MKTIAYNFIQKTFEKLLVLVETRFDNKMNNLNICTNLTVFRDIIDICTTSSILILILTTYKIPPAFSLFDALNNQCQHDGYKSLQIKPR